MRILGIDPGITGGLAMLLDSTPVYIGDIPNVGGEVDVDTFAGLIRSVQIDHALIERAHAMPKQGVSSTFKYGQAYGSLIAVVVACRIPHRRVSPQVWKKHFRLGADKEQSRALAIRLWPGVGSFGRKKDHGKAEAALIARYGDEVLFKHREAA